MRKPHDRKGGRRFVAALLLPLLMALLAPPAILAAPPVRELEPGSSGAIDIGSSTGPLSGSAGDPIGGERLPPRSFPVSFKFEVTASESDGSSTGSGSATAGDLSQVCGWSLGWMVPGAPVLTCLLLRLGILGVESPSGIGR